MSKVSLKGEISRDIYQELRTIGLTHDQCCDVLDWSDTLPVHLTGSHITVRKKGGTTFIEQEQLVEGVPNEVIDAMEEVYSNLSAWTDPEQQTVNYHFYMMMKDKLGIEDE